MSDLTPEQLAAIEARDEAWTPRCQYRFDEVVDWGCDWPRERHPVSYLTGINDHDFEYDPDLDTSPEADRRRLLEALR